MRFFFPKNLLVTSSFQPITALSANPFEAGWYGGVLTCLTPLLLRNSANSLLVNVVALSETITSGNPIEANDFLTSSIVTALVVVVVM